MKNQIQHNRSYPPPPPHWRKTLTHSLKLLTLLVVAISLTISCKKDKPKPGDEDPDANKQWVNIGLPTGITNAEIYTIACSGDDCYLGGKFMNSGQLVSAIYKYNNGTWSDLNAGITNGYVRAIAIDPADNKVYVGGGFDNAGGSSNPGADNIAVWNPANGSWRGLKFGVGDNTEENFVTSIAIGASNIVVGGTFLRAHNSSSTSGNVSNSSNLVRWNKANQTWYAINRSGTPNFFVTSALCRNNNSLFTVGGSGGELFTISFTEDFSNNAFNNALGSTGSPQINGPVNTITTNGGDYVIAGEFTATDTKFNNIFRYGGGTAGFSAMCSGMDGHINSLTDDIVLGGFSVFCGGLGKFLDNNGSEVKNAINIARWDDRPEVRQWKALGTGLNSEVKGIAIGNNKLYAVGSFLNTNPDDKGEKVSIKNFGYYPLN